MIYDITLKVVDSSTSTTHAGAAISIQTEKVVGQVSTGDGGGITDGDKGDVTVSAGGTVWTVDGRAITAPKLFEVGANKLLGRHTGTPGDAQEIGVDGGLEFHGGNLRRSALTGDVTASAGDGATTIANGAVSTAKMGVDVTAAGKALLDDADAAAQRTTLGLGTAATSNTSAFEASGSIATHSAVTSGVHGISAFAATVLDDANAAAARATLGAVGGTTGATDNALLRADGTGGATAQSSTVTISDTGVITSTFYEISTATFSSAAFTQFKALGTNASVQICPTGTGCITAQMPDGLVAGGNARGARAVDLQLSRSVADRVASGADSFAVGTNNMAAAASSGAGGTGTVVTSAGTNSFSWGNGNSVSASNASAIGWGCSVTAATGVATGDGARSYIQGQRSHASWGGSQAQITDVVLQRTTTNATTTALFVDGSSARFIVPANSSGRCRVVIVARRATAGNETMTWVREVAWQRGVAASTTTIDVQTIGTDRGFTGGAWGAGPPWSAGIVADTTNGGFEIQGTGALATNIRWAASVQPVELIFA